MFTAEDIKRLAELERRMDAGDIKYVVYYGNRMAVNQKQLDEFGLVSGQTINSAIAIAITTSCMRDVEQKILDECSPKDFE